MMTARKRWWRAAAIAAVGGVVVTGGWLGLRGKGQPAKAGELPPESINWSRATAPPPPAPVVTEVERTPEAAPPTGPVTPAGATLPPIPTSGALPPIPMAAGNGIPVAPAIPVTPPLIVPAAPLPVPTVGPAVPAIEPIVGPRLPDAGLTGGDKSALPAVPPIPSLPPAKLPELPVPPKTPEVKPVVPPAPADLIPAPSGGTLPIPPMPALPVPGGTSTPNAVPPMPVAPAPTVPTAPNATAPALPPLPASTAEPPKAPVPPAPGGVVVPPMPSGLPVPPMPSVPGALPLPQPAPVAPSMPPVKSADPVQPMLPAKPDSDLKPSNPGNTLNPTVAPTVPVVPGAGREVTGVPSGLPKPTEPSFNPTDKYVFPVKPIPDPRVPHQRDDTMLNLTTTAAFAFLGGAMLAVEKANVPPAAPPVGAVSPMPAAPLKFEVKDDVDKLKTDLEKANKKIEDLEKHVKRLESLLTGKKDELGFLVNPKEPGTVEDVKALKDKIASMQKEIDNLKTQTSLKPAIVPEVKPKGIVRIVNEYPVEISMVVNEKSYRVAPNTKLDVEVNAGDFSYQLLQSGAAVTKSVIKDKETVTLRIK